MLRHVCDYLIDLEIKFLAEGFKDLIYKTQDKIISDFPFLWDLDLNKLYSYLDTLTLAQESALFNILLFIIILLSLCIFLGF